MASGGSGQGLAAEAMAPPRDRSPDPAEDAGSRRRLALQRAVARLAAPVCVPLAVLVMRLGFRWRIRDAAPARALYARLLADRRPLLIAANHLTMADSALIGWGLGSAGGHVLRHRGLPWNVPEQSPRGELLAVAGAGLRDEVPSRSPAAASDRRWRRCSSAWAT